MAEKPERAAGGGATDGGPTPDEQRIAQRVLLTIFGIALLVLVMFLGLAAARSGRAWGLFVSVGAVMGMVLIFTVAIWRHAPRGRGLRAFRPEDLARPRSAGSFRCQRCGYAIGDLPPHRPSGDAAILCPECGLVNRLPVMGPPICGACGETLGRKVMPVGTVLHCPKCHVAWRIRA